MKGILSLVAVLLWVGSAHAETSPVRLQSRTIIPNPDVSFSSRGVQSTQISYLFVQLKDDSIPRLHSDNLGTSGAPGSSDSSTSSVAASSAELLSNLGVKFLRSIPDDTWIVSVPPAAWASPVLQEQFEWIGAIDPTDKIPARLREGRMADWAVRAGGRAALRVRFHDGVDPEDMAAALEGYGAVLLSKLTVFPGWNVVLDMDRLLDVAALEPVLWINESIPLPALENDGSRASTGAGDLQSLGAGLTGAGVRVGVMDGGSVSHPDLNDHLTNIDMNGDDSHATHVSGTLAGSGAGSVAAGGTELQWRGMAPEAELFNWDRNGDVLSKMADAFAIYDVDLHTNSWGIGVSSANCELYGNYDLIVPDLDALVNGSAGKRVQIVFSGGNERDDGDCPLVDGGYGCLNPPKSAKNLLVVGAINSDNDTMTEFSSWGPTDDGRLKPDIVAPGCEDGGEGYIKSTLRDPIDYGGPNWCGTSMAAPAATGVLAQLMELNETVEPGIQLEPSFLRATLAATAVDLGNPGPDYAFGHGRISGVDAAASVANETRHVFSMVDSAVVEYSFHVPEGAAQVRLVLAWDDPDALPMSAKALVNDFDLLLISPDATEYDPWILDPLQPSLDAVRGPDHINNIEHTSIDDPLPGIWTARVTGHNVPEGPQIVSLVGIDLKAPQTGPFDLAAANETDTSIALTWKEDRTYDYFRTVLVRYTGTLSWAGPVDGEALTPGQEVAPGEFVAYVGKDNHVGFPFVDGGLDPATEYHYVAYMVDTSWNFSPSDSTSGLTTNVASVDIAPTIRFALRDPAPNPARDASEIVFSLPSSEKVTLSVFDPSGRRIRTLLDAPHAAGLHSVVWDGTNDHGRKMAPGIYFYELQAGKNRATKQVSWIR